MGGLSIPSMAQRSTFKIRPKLLKTNCQDTRLIMASRLCYASSERPSLAPNTAWAAHSGVCVCVSDHHPHFSNLHYLTYHLHFNIQDLQQRSSHRGFSIELSRLLRLLWSFLSSVNDCKVVNIRANTVELCFCMK